MISTPFKVPRLQAVGFKCCSTTNLHPCVLGWSAGAVVSMSFSFDARSTEDMCKALAACNPAALAGVESGNVGLTSCVTWDKNAQFTQCPLGLNASVATARRCNL